MIAVAALKLPHVGHVPFKVVTSDSSDDCVESLMGRSKFGELQISIQALCGDVIEVRLSSDQGKGFVKCTGQG